MTINTDFHMGDTVAPNADGSYTLDFATDPQGYVVEPTKVPLFTGRYATAQIAFNMLYNQIEGLAYAKPSRRWVSIKGSVVKCDNGTYRATADIEVSHRERTRAPIRSDKRANVPAESYRRAGMTPPTEQDYDSVANDEMPTNGIITRADGLFQSA